jgi:hypothetical protein
MVGERPLRVMGCLCGRVRSTSGVPRTAADFAAPRKSAALGQKGIEGHGSVAPTIELPHGEEDTVKLISIAQSPTESASRVERARILLTFCKGPKCKAYLAHSRYT